MPKKPATVTRFPLRQPRRVGRPPLDKSREVRTVTVSMPGKIYELLIASAEKNLRSISAEVSHIVRAQLEKK